MEKFNQDKKPDEKKDWINPWTNMPDDEDPEDLGMIGLGEVIEVDFTERTFYRDEVQKYDRDQEIRDALSRHPSNHLRD